MQSLRTTVPWYLPLIAFVLLAGNTFGQERLLANGSFEAGQTAPEGWHFGSGARWASGGAQNGLRWVAVGSARGNRVCQSDAIKLQLGAPYRLEGWLQASDGEARLG